MWLHIAITSKLLSASSRWSHPPRETVQVTRARPRARTSNSAKNQAGAIITSAINGQSIIRRIGGVRSRDDGPIRSRRIDARSIHTSHDVFSAAEDAFDLWGRRVISGVISRARRGASTLGGELIESGGRTVEITRKSRQPAGKRAGGQGRVKKQRRRRENPPQLVKGSRSVSLAYVPLVFPSTWESRPVSGVQSHGGLRRRRRAGNTRGTQRLRRRLPVYFRWPDDESCWRIILLAHHTHPFGPFARKSHGGHSRVTTITTKSTLEKFSLSLSLTYRESQLCLRCEIRGQRDDEGRRAKAHDS